MKKFSAIFASVALLVTALFIISTSAAASRKKDPNCLNRCQQDYLGCMKTAKNQNPNIVDRFNSEDECQRQRNNCRELCPNTLE